MTRDRVIVGLIVIAIAVAAVARGLFDVETLIEIACIIPCIVLHEVSHGFAAYLLGDDTAKRARRLTLNPVRHVDIFGTILLPLLLALAGLTPFGYAKPVPVNPAKMRHPRNGALLATLAGPATNVILAVIGGLVIHAVIAHDLATATESVGSSLWDQALLFFGEINVALAVFNLIPIPPLDGSAVVERLLPQDLWQRYLRIRSFALIAVVALVLLAPQVISDILNPFLTLWIRAFLRF